MSPMTRITTLCIAAAGGLIAAPASADERADEPDSSLEDRYWRWYGFISDGSMARPEAFLNYGREPGEPPVPYEDEIGTAEPEPAPSAETTIVDVDPEITEACGLDERPVVHFEFDSATPQEEGEQLLEELAACLAEHPIVGDDYLSITGHADPRGTEEYNRGLGLDRADAVASLLMDEGVEGDRIDTYSWGEAKAPDDPDQWDEARRVVVQLDR